MKEICKSDIFIEWLKRLKDIRAKAILDIRINRLIDGNPGDSRFLGDISELRIDYKDTGKEIIILLCGGDKIFSAGRY